jgi:hypothetical protein
MYIDPHAHMISRTAGDYEAIDPGSSGSIGCRGRRGDDRYTCLYFLTIRHTAPVFGKAWAIGPAPAGNAVMAPTSTT